MPFGPKPPKPAPVSQVVAGQTASNQAALTGTQTAQQTSQVTPFGNLNYIQTGVDTNGIPQFTAISNLSPEQQAILTNLQNTQTELGGAGTNLANAVFNQYSQPPDFSEAAGTQTRINMERQLAYLNPFFEQQTEQLDNQLRNQGLTPGTEAYDRALRTLRDNQNQSVMRFLNETQPTAFNQAREQFNQPLQTLGGIMGLTQPASLTNNLINTPKPSLNAADYIGANTAFNQANMERYKAQVAQQNALMQGIFTLGGAAMGVPMIPGMFGGMGGITGATTV